MSTDRETTRVVRSWLEEGVTRLPDRVLDAVLDQVPATHQRRRFSSAWRVLNMNSPVRYAIAAAAVLVVALVGYQFLPTSSPGPGAVASLAPLESPSASVTPPTVTPSASVTPVLPDTDSLAAGTYRPYPDLDVTVEAPAGWATCCASPAWIVHNGESSDPGFAALFFEDFTEVTVYDDPCQGISGSSSAPRGAAAVAAAIAAQEGSDTPEAEAVTVGGRSAYRVRLTVPDDLEITIQSDGDATFLDCTGGQYTLYTFPGGDRYAQNLSQREDIYLVDVGDRTLGFDLSTFPGTAAASAAELEAMLESIVIP